VSRVQFERTETIVDGPLVRVESWTEQGDVLEVRPDGRVRVEWEDPHWGATVCVFHPEEVQPLRTG